MCVKNSYDITDLEAQRFLEAVEKLTVDFIDSFAVERLKKSGSMVIRDYMDGDNEARSKAVEKQLNAELPPLSMMTEMTLQDQRYRGHF